MKWICARTVCELHFWSVKRSDPPPPSAPRSIYSRPRALRPAFPTKPPQPQFQPWGPGASLSQIESQILLGRGNREAQEEWMARLCHVMSADEWSEPRRRQAKSRVFMTDSEFAVIFVWNGIFQKSVALALIWRKSEPIHPGKLSSRFPTFECFNAFPGLISRFSLQLFLAPAFFTFFESACVPSRLSWLASLD